MQGGCGIVRARESAGDRRTGIDRGVCFKNKIAGNTLFFRGILRDCHHARKTKRGGAGCFGKPDDAHITQRRIDFSIFIRLGIGLNKTFAEIEFDPFPTFPICINKGVEIFTFAIDHIHTDPRDVGLRREINPHAQPAAITDDTARKIEMSLGAIDLRHSLKTQSWQHQWVLLRLAQKPHLWILQLPTARLNPGQNARCLHEHFLKRRISFGDFTFRRREVRNGNSSKNQRKNQAQCNTAHWRDAK